MPVAGGRRQVAGGRSTTIQKDTNWHQIIFELVRVIRGPLFVKLSQTLDFNLLGLRLEWKTATTLSSPTVSS